MPIHGETELSGVAEQFSVGTVQEPLIEVNVAPVSA